MISADRFHSALDLSLPDRVPLFYQHLGAAKWVLQSTGLRMHDGFHDPEIFSRISMAAYDLYGFDNVMAGWGDIMVEAQAHGMTWRFPERDFYPRVDEYVPMSDIDKIHAVDPMDDRFWSVPIEAAEIMTKRYRGEVPVIGCINAPMLIASEIIGLEHLLMGCLTEPSAVDHVLSAVTESSEAYGERISDIGLEDVFIENGTAGNELMDLDTYERFDRKYLRIGADSFHQKGLRTIIHNCSAEPFWKSQSEIGPTAIHLNLRFVRMEEITSDLKSNVAFIAGIDHTDLLLNGTREDIDKSVRETMAAWDGDPGLIIGPGCEFPYKTPRENILALKECTIEHGTYL
ncbi:MAG: uroporphyrinogen decarboxylase family protein [Candidatus Methanomethylophilaceae archaeon]|jgi:uroporphyrinogen decarboxylase|nr:hypothetical protein AOA81_04465 [Methanomassiliicoccales archaeon RumEn M2]MDD3128122.1 uroporphyrinogen decarboxylase family protein [Candidatus Methanomethylophilaceae archaeon]MDD4454458.1 uroporphyrinogen decarboxylase family protein [Candidatus Methanomethylophilaceae archaeon]MDI9378395.1 uroporphyrinogen decarboxylase family protein [Candidatus Thermoplasmatota archaeon]